MVVVAEQDRKRERAVALSPSGAVFDRMDTVERYRHWHRSRWMAWNIPVEEVLRLSLRPACATTPDSTLWLLCYLFQSPSLCPGEVKEPYTMTPIHGQPIS